MFAFLFGLSMDEVFLLARIREEYDRGRSGITIDATFVRGLLASALVAGLGHFNRWWPLRDRPAANRGADHSRGR